MTLIRYCSILATVVLSAASVYGSANAAGTTSNLKLGWLSEQTAAERTVRTDASTKYVNVAHLETVAIQNDKGQSFVWTFDTYGDTQFPLKAIAPAGFESGTVIVSVRHPPEHLWPAY